MKENMRLLAGQRFLLEDDKSFWQVLSGQVEVYAVPSSGKLSFRVYFQYRTGQRFIRRGP